MIKEKIDISGLEERMLQEDFGYPDILNTVNDKGAMYV
jgi:hypothetical protein